MKKTLGRLAALVCIGLMLCCGVGCRASDDTVFTAVIATLPQTLDPQLAQSDAECIIAANFFEGLFRKNAEGQPMPAACESYTVSADGLEWTFTLKEDLHYNDDNATPLTAEDYAFGLRRLFETGVNSPYTTVFLGLENAGKILDGTAEVSALGVRATDERTLVIRLEAPDDAFLLKLCCAGAMPCNREFFESCEGTYGLDTNTTLANGRFRISLWSEENGVTLRRIEPQKGLVNKVRLIFAAENSTPAQRLADGVTSGEFITGVPEDENVNTFCVQTQMLLFNCSDAQLCQPQLRAGLASLVYRSLPETAAEGLSMAGGLVPDSVTLAGKSWREQVGSLLNRALPEDAAAAYRTGLEALGKNKLSGITVLVPDTEEWRTLYEEISLTWQKQLAAFFSVQYLPEDEIVTRVEKGDYQLAFLTRRASQDNVLAELTAYTTANSGNRVQFSDPVYDEMIAACRQAGSPAEQKPLLEQAETYLLSQWCAVPIYTLTDHFACAAGFGGIIAYPFGPVLDFTEAFSTN